MKRTMIYLILGGLLLAVAIPATAQDPHGLVAIEVLQERSFETTSLGTFDVFTVRDCTQDTLDSWGADVTDMVMPPISYIPITYIPKVVGITEVDSSTIYLVIPQGVKKLEEGEFIPAEHPPIQGEVVQYYHTSLGDFYVVAAGNSYPDYLTGLLYVNNGQWTVAYHYYGSPVKNVVTVGQELLVLHEDGNSTTFDPATESFTQLSPDPQ